MPEASQEDIPFSPPTYFLEMRFHVSQASLELSKYQKITLNRLCSAFLMLVLYVYTIMTSFMQYYK